MRPEHDAISAVFGGAGDHLLISLRHQQSQQNRLHVTIDRVTAWIGGIRRQMLEIVGVSCLGAAEVLARVLREVRLGLEWPGIAERVGLSATHWWPIGPAKDVRGAVDVGQDQFGLSRNRLPAVTRSVGEEVLARI